MRKFSNSLIKIISLVLSGILVTVAVSMSYVVLNVFVTALFGALSGVIGTSIAGVCLFIAQYLLVVGLIVFVWMNILNPNMLINPIANFIMFAISSPIKLVKLLYQSVQIYAYQAYSWATNLFTKKQLA